MYQTFYLFTRQFSIYLSINFLFIYASIFYLSIHPFSIYTTTHFLYIYLSIIYLSSNYQTLYTLRSLTQLSNCWCLSSTDISWRACTNSSFLRTRLFVSRFSSLFFCASRRIRSANAFLFSCFNLGKIFI